MQNLNVFSSEKSVSQLWLKQYSVDSSLTQMTIGMIRLWLDSYPWFSRPTQLWLDSFESESSQIWLTTHESSTTLLPTLPYLPTYNLVLFQAAAESFVRQKPKKPAGPEAALQVSRMWLRGTRFPAPLRGPLPSGLKRGKKTLNIALLATYWLLRLI